MGSIGLGALPRATLDPPQILPDRRWSAWAASAAPSGARSEPQASEVKLDRAPQPQRSPEPLEHVAQRQPPCPALEAAARGRARAEEVVGGLDLEAARDR